MKKFKESEKSTFRYWFAHWFAFQYVACKLNVWNPLYLFHDIEKPFLMKAWKDYPKVREWHRKHNRHHYQYDDGSIAPWLNCDYIAMVVDWECSRLTKESEPLNAFETFCKEMEEAFDRKDPLTIHQLYHYFLGALQDLKMVPEEFYTSDLYRKLQDGTWTKWNGKKVYVERYNRLPPDDIDREGNLIFYEKPKVERKWIKTPKKKQ